MKKIILTSLAASIAMIAGQAHAIVGTNPAAVNAANPTYMAGSSAATPLIEKSFDGVCNGTVFKYSANGSLAWACDANPGFTGPLVLHKRESGGSVTGINGAKAIPQSYINFGAIAAGAITCGAADPVTSIASCTIAGTVPMKTAISEINFSDVDSAQFVSPLNGGISGAGALTNTAVATQIFGVTVNKTLRDAMQAAMIDAGVLPGCTVGNETEKCMPNLSTAQISTIFGKDRANDWRNLRFGNGAVTQNLFSAATAHGLAVPSNRSIHICSRTTGSGTLATFNLKFHNAPCTAVAEPVPSKANNFVDPAATGTTVAKAVHSMSGSGDVEDCLEGLNNGAAKGLFTPYPTTGAAWAIGIMGTERNLTNAKNYRFIKINNVSPAGHNVVEGRYPFWAELVRVGGTLTDPVAIDITSRMSDPVKIGQLITTPNANFGPTQLLAVASTVNLGTLAPNRGYDSLKPVNVYTHGTVAGPFGINHCRVPTVPGAATPIPTFYPLF